MGRNVRGLGALYRLIGGGTPARVVEFDGAVGSVVDAAPDYPWLNALVCEPGADFKRVLERVVQTEDLVRLAVRARDPDQVDTAAEAGFTNLIAAVPAMSMELDHVEAGGCTSEPIAMAEAGALSDAAYANAAHEVERTLAQIPTGRMQARGRRDATGQIVTAAVALDVDDDCSVQYVATRPGRATTWPWPCAAQGHAGASAHPRCQHNFVAVLRGRCASLPAPGLPNGRNSGIAPQARSQTRGITRRRANARAYVAALT